MKFTALMITFCLVTGGKEIEQATQKAQGEDWH